MSSPENPSRASQTTRRRILRAAAVAPVFYTLPSGAVTAAASATCVANANNATSFPPASITGTDQYVRQTVQVQQIRINGNWITVYQINNLWYDSSGTQQLIPNGNGNTQNPHTENVLVLAHEDLATHLIDYKVYPVGRISTGGYTPLGGTCWASVVKTPALGSGNLIG